MIKLMNQILTLCITHIFSKPLLRFVCTQEQSVSLFLAQWVIGKEKAT